MRGCYYCNLGSLYQGAGLRGEGKLLLEKFRLGQKTISEFKKQMAELVASFKSEYKKPLFILVDELDRCRPPYAVALLERVKHLFDVDDVVFVMATDTEQLRHSIGALYGVNFAAGRYLLRFFDQTYRFEEASIEKFVARQFEDVDQSKLYGSPDLDAAKFTAKALKAFNLSLRDVEQCVDIMRNCATAWSSPSPLVMVVLVPLVVMQQQRMDVRYGSVKERLEERLGSISWANLDFNVWDEQRKKKKFNGFQLFEQFINKTASYTIQQIANEDDSSPPSVVIQRILIEEVQARFPNGHQRNNSHVSLIRDYPAFVRSVGRLTPT